jgi:hypothetical protein
MKLLVSGCSFTDPNQMTWPNLLLGNQKVNVINLGKTSAGNGYIANSIMNSVLDFQPDFVFVLWSGINRSELRVPNSAIFKNQTDYKQADAGNSLYYLSGGGLDIEQGWLAGYQDIKAPEWPEITSMDQWFQLPIDIKQECLQHKLYLSTDEGTKNLSPFVHQYFLTQTLIDNPEYRSEVTFQNIMNCFNLLEKRSIPYRFSFIYDIWARHNQNSLGQAVKEKYYSEINWKKFINLPPFEYGVKHNLLSDDGFHLTQDGMAKWADQISLKLQQDQELSKFFIY